MKLVAKAEDFDMSDFTPMKLDLTSFASVNNFAEELDKFRGDRPVERLACNAAVYQPTLKSPKWTHDGHEQQLQTNFLSHFLLTSKVMPMMKNSEDPRVCMIGSPLKGNDNAMGGSDGKYPIADLQELEGLNLGCRKPVAMMDGSNFNGAKAYKDTKLAMMMLSNLLHERYHRSSEISFSSVYPGCLETSPLFKEKREWFKKYFPEFLKYMKGSFVGEEEAGQRLFQVLHDLRCRKSGVEWGWNGGPLALEDKKKVDDTEGVAGVFDSIFEKDQSASALNKDLMMQLFRCASEITGADWPPSYQPKSPCPTLKVVGAATSVLGVLEEQARMSSSREGVNAKLVSDHSLPKDTRRQALEQMLLALDTTPTDPLDLEYDLLRTSGKSPASIAVEKAKFEKQIQEREAATVAALENEAAGPSEAQMLAIKAVSQTLLSRLRRKSTTNLKDVTEDELKTAFANENMKIAEQVATAGLVSPSDSSQETKEAMLSALTPEVDDPAGSKAADLELVEPEEKGPPKMIEGHELLGDIPVVFQPKNIMTMARVGQSLSEVASNADVFIRYKCRKGECKTCVVNINDRWVSACQTKIPPVGKGQFFEVYVRPVADSSDKERKSVFFSPQSLAEGAMNNALGMVGFVRDGFEGEADFQIRMERERLIDDMAAKKAAKKAEESVKAK
jgi:light-dependent protochlorophyllide reductase